MKTHFFSVWAGALGVLAMVTAATAATPAEAVAEQDPAKLCELLTTETSGVTLVEAARRLPTMHGMPPHAGETLARATMRVTHPATRQLLAVSLVRVPGDAASQQIQRALRDMNADDASRPAMARQIVMDRLAPLYPLAAPVMGNEAFGRQLFELRQELIACGEPMAAALTTVAHTRGKAQSVTIARRIAAIIRKEKTDVRAAAEETFGNNPSFETMSMFREQYGAAAQPYFKRMLTHPSLSDDARALVLRTLREMDDKSAVPVAMKLARNKDVAIELRGEALRVLGKFQGSASFALMMTSATDYSPGAQGSSPVSFMGITSVGSDFPIAEAGIYGLGYVKGPAQEKAYQALVRSLKETDKPAIVRAAVGALATLGDARTAEALKSAAQEMRGSQPGLAHELDEAVGRLGGAVAPEGAGPVGPRVLLHLIVYRWDGGQLSVLTNTPLWARREPGAVQVPLAGSESVEQISVHFPADEVARMKPRRGPASAEYRVTVNGMAADFLDLRE